MIDENNTVQKWRFLIALAHADKRLAQKERVFLEERIRKELSDNVYQGLMTELQNGVLTPPEPDFHFFNISEPEDKIDVLKLAHSLFWVDGNLDVREKSYLDIIIGDVKKDEQALAALKARLPKWTESKNERSLRSYIEGHI